MNGSSDLFDSLLQQKINCFALLLSPLILLFSFFFPLIFSKWSLSLLKITNTCEAQYV